MDLRAKLKTIKCLEDKTGENLCDLALGKDFLDETPKTYSIKKIIETGLYQNFKKSALLKTDVI